LAAGWLEYTGAALATSALEAGPFEGARIIELCAFILRAISLQVERQAPEEGEDG
jgi:hypothetical protein